MRSKGTAYEKLALKHLEKQGLELISKNYYCKQGEIDLIMQDGNTLAFIEVRYRKSNAYGSPEESITPTKQAKIIRAARYFLSEKQLWHLISRFDVVSISENQNSTKTEFTWIKSAFYT